MARSTKLMLIILLYTYDTILRIQIKHFIYLYLQRAKPHSVL